MRIDNGLEDGANHKQEGMRVSGGSEDNGTTINGRNKKNFSMNNPSFMVGLQGSRMDHYNRMDMR